MGGKILTLPSDYIKQGRLEGLQEGELYKARRVYQNCISRGMSEEDALAISELREAEEGMAKSIQKETQTV